MAKFLHSSSEITIDVFFQAFLFTYKCTHTYIYIYTSINVHTYVYMYQFSSVAQSCLDSLWLHEPQHARPPCPLPTPRVYPNSCPSSRWCHPTISSSVIPFSSCPQSFPASWSFQMSQLFASGGQSYWGFSFNISPSSEHSGLISFRMDICTYKCTYVCVYIHTYTCTYQHSHT